VTQPIALDIERLAAGGDGVAHDEDGRVVFVPLTAPGDRVRVHIVERHKRFARGEVVEVVEPGPDRVEPPCPLFGRCGGCVWQHLSYPAQLRAKAAIVSDALRRIGRIDCEEPVPVTASPEPFGYRVRTRLVQDGVRLGYRSRRSHEVCIADACPVLDPRLESVLATERTAARSGGEPVEWEAAVGSDGVVRVQRTGAAGTTIDQVVGGDALRVSHEVFAQANGLLVESLAEAVVQAALGGGGGGGACVELYAGGGLFTLGLSRRFDQVWAVESHPGAVRDLRVNLARADRQNVRIREGRVEQVLASLEIAPDVLVLDPPRTGVSEDALAAISGLRVGRIVYVSCDPATLARDLGRLRDEGYRLASVQAFDLFPQTPHVEVLATLEGS
jgi:23S rRNA (uracil1939-C5)-methyltransferase